MTPTPAQYALVAAQAGLTSAEVEACYLAAQAKGGVGLTKEEKMILALFVLWVACELRPQQVPH